MLIYFLDIQHLSLPHFSDEIKFPNRYWQDFKQTIVSVVSDHSFFTDLPLNLISCNFFLQLFFNGTTLSLVFLSQFFKTFFYFQPMFFSPTKFVPFLVSTFDMFTMFNFELSINLRILQISRFCFYLQCAVWKPPNFFKAESAQSHGSCHLAKTFEEKKENFGENSWNPTVEQLFSELLAAGFTGNIRKKGNTKSVQQKGIVEIPIIFKSKNKQGELNKRSMILNTSHYSQRWHKLEIFPNPPPPCLNLRNIYGYTCISRTKTT